MEGSLTLSRKESQSLVIGEALVTITRIKGTRVIVNVQAPRDVPIIRGELLQTQGESDE